MASHQQHHGTLFSHEPLPMGGSPRTFHTVPQDMQHFLVPLQYANKQARGKAVPRGKVAGTATSKKAKAKAQVDDGKRSRHELNRREKERMHLLNERIDQIKDILEDAGVRPKRTKQSVLDNAAFYIERLQGDLAIAQQAAELAEKDFSRACKSARSDSDNIYERCFQQSTMARVIVDVNLKLLAANAAFTEHAGHDTKYLVKKSYVRKYLTKEKGKLEATVKSLHEHAKPMAFATTAASFHGDIHVMLTASPVNDDDGKLSKIEFSLVPLETPANDGEATARSSDGMESVLF